MRLAVARTQRRAVLASGRLVSRRRHFPDLPGGARPFAVVTGQDAVSGSEAMRPGRKPCLEDHRPPHPLVPTADAAAVLWQAGAMNWVSSDQWRAA